MTLQEILYEIKINGRNEYMNDLFQTLQVKSILRWIVANYPTKQKEAYSAVCFMIKKVILTNYKYQEEATEAKFVNFMRKVLPQRVYRIMVKEDRKHASIEQYENKLMTKDFSDGLLEKIDLRKAIQHLKESERDLINDLFFNNKTEVQIAQDLGLNQSTVNRRKIKILAKLYNML